MRISSIGTILTVAMAYCGLATTAQANHEATAKAEETAEYVSADMPQQYAWKHGVAISGAAAGTEAPTMQVAGAGPFMSFDLALDNTIIYGSDEVLFGDTFDNETSLFITGYTAGGWMMGLGLSVDVLSVDGDIDMNQTSYAVDMFAAYNVWKGLTLGGFVSYIYSDLENKSFTLNGGPGQVGGETHRIGGGILASYQCQWREYTFNTTTSLASMNNVTFTDVWDTEYTSWNNLLSVYRPLTDKLGAEVYGSYVRLLDSPSLNRRDTEIVNLGGELSYQVNADWTLRAGYERSFLYSGYENHMFNVGVLYAW